MTIACPDWIRPAIPITDKDRTRLNSARRSWNALSPKLADMSETDLLKIILLECEDQKRPIIIARVLSRFRSKRQGREDGEMFNLAKTVVRQACPTGTTRART